MLLPSNFYALRMLFATPMRNSTEANRAKFLSSQLSLDLACAKFLVRSLLREEAPGITEDLVLLAVGEESRPETRPKLLFEKVPRESGRELSSCHISHRV
jgi:hypothetical protein